MIFGNYLWLQHYVAGKPGSDTPAYMLSRGGTLSHPMERVFEFRWGWAGDRKKVLLHRDERGDWIVFLTSLRRSRIGVRELCCRWRALRQPIRLKDRHLRSRSILRCDKTAAGLASIFFPTLSTWSLMVRSSVVGGSSASSSTTAIRAVNRDL